MVGLGIMMLALVIGGRGCGWRGRLFRSPWFLRLCELASPLGFIAVLAGWITTEVGRQPWTVYGLLRTADSVSPSLTGWDVLVSLLGYIIAYAVIFPSGWVVMSRIVRAGPRRWSADERGRSRAVGRAIRSTRTVRFARRDAMR